MTAPTLPLLRSTVPGKVSGIVCLDPFTLQCADCGVTVTQQDVGTKRIAATIILSGFHFHICEGREGVRRCPSCLAAAKQACESSRCKR